jgi:pimeloyl-ACP methyl ester carboxylesterase
VSTPPFLDLPDGVRAVRLSTARGPLATLVADARGAERKPPVLLVPGFTGSKEDFIAVLEPIAAEGHPVTAIDQRGQFESPGDDDPASYDVKLLAEDVLSVVARIGEPVHLLGHSFGGLVARAAALADPTAVRSLALLSSGPAAIPDPSASNLSLLAQALPSTDLQTIWTVKRRLELDGRTGPPAAIEAFLRRRFLANNPVCLLRHAEQLLTETDRVAEVAALDLPLLVAYGVRDDAWPPAVQAEMASRLGATVAEIPDAAHSPAAENPAATAGVLTRFWEATH